jgi:sigma-B regulation protein RsbU (phosphoserine phosphatase)
MVTRPASLQGRFTFFLILPVLGLLVVMGVAGFFYARDLLLDQWREAAILKLQRAAHEMDMHLIRIKEGIRLFHETSGAHYDDSFHAWALERLTRQDGIVDIKLSWYPPEEGDAASPDSTPSVQAGGRGSGSMGKLWRLRRFHSASIREITAPRFDAGGEHGTISMISELLNERGQAIGRLVVVANFDFIFKHVVESGWWQSNKAYLVDETGRILVCTVPGRQGMIYDSDDPVEKATFKAMAHGAYGTVRGEGHPPSEVSGFFRIEEAPWFLVMIAPGHEILSSIIEFRWIYSIFAVGFIAVIVALIRVVTGRLASEIRKVSAAALRLSQGDFGEPLPVKSRDEVGELVRSFNLMASQLEERLRLKEAMNLAMEVQQNLLPASPPSVPGLDIAGRSLYCQETGGDYFDYIFRPGPAGGRRLCVAVGDVVGHGISAALLMTTARALLRLRLDQPGSIAEAVGDVNRLLYQDTAPSGSFVTLFLLEVDLPARRLEWVRAGHDPALLYCAATDDVHDLGGPGMALGVEEACAYLSGRRSGLGAGDVLLIGTDGIWESRNTNSEKFGKERIGRIVQSHSRLSAEGILQAILSALEDFRGGALPDDDVTLLVIKAKAATAGEWSP